MLILPELSINPELEKWIIPLTSDEFDGLTKSILADGCRDPLVVWGNVLIDGHNRFRICSKHGIDFQTVSKDFDSLDDAKNWMIHNQLGRRNLTPEQKGDLIGRVYNEQKNAIGTNRYADKCPQNDDTKRTSEVIAEQFKVSKATVERAGKFSESLDVVESNCGKEIRNNILKREYHITKSDVIKLSQLPPEAQRKVIGEVQSGKHAKDAIDRVFGCSKLDKSDFIVSEDDPNFLKLPCGNPRCQNPVLTTKKQYREMVGVFPEKYGKVNIMYCSKGCRDAHMFRVNARSRQ